MSIKTPRLIKDRCGVYYFRWIVPLSWRQFVGKTELRRSLRTKDAIEARHKALSLSLAVEALVVDPKFLANPTLADFQHLLGSDADVRKHMRIDFFNGIIETDTLAEAQEAKAIVAEMAQTHKQRMLDGVSAVLPTSRSSTMLEAAISSYLAEKASTLKPATLLKTKGVLNDFIAHTGNIDLALIASSTVKGYKDSQLQVKKRSTTINDKISILNNFFSYCIGNKLARMENPTTGLFIKGANNTTSSYKPFSSDELKRIFQPDLYIKKMRLPDFYWGPLIALFTGMRAEEIASLRVDQITTDFGVWLINIEGGKTVNAARRVPLHDQLIKLGLIEYVEWVQKAGYTRLFPHLVPGKNGFKKNMCRMFGVYLDLPEVNIVDPLKVFHSFRHTVITKLTDKGVSDGLKKSMVGHDAETVESAHDDYIHAEELTLDSMRKAINRLDYLGVDFGMLKILPSAFSKNIANRLV